jgi:Ni/Co efflux regulator RcnB
VHSADIQQTTREMTCDRTYGEILMNRLHDTKFKFLCWSALFAALAAGSPAFADKKAHGKEQGKGHHEYEKRESHSQHDDHHGDRAGTYFSDQHRIVIHEYYDDEFKHGRCPPGLAKKHNGCMPPGQARRWAVGQPLASDVVYYELPSSIVVRLGIPPAGQRYVQIANDILLIAVGTRMVIDGLDGLGSR